MKQKRKKKAETLNNKLKTLHKKVASFESGKAAVEEGVPEKGTATDSPPVGAGQQIGGRASSSGCNSCNVHFCECMV